MNETSSQRAITKRCLRIFELHFVERPKKSKTFLKKIKHLFARLRLDVLNHRRTKHKRQNSKTSKVLFVFVAKRLDV